MNMLATELSVRNYRSFDGLELSFAPGTTVLVGRNAVGKTNLVEAVQLLTAGQSFRRPSPSDLVREGASSCRLELKIEGEGRLLDMGLEASEGKRTFFRNGKKVAAAGVRGELPSVLFCPDHLDMVKRSASVRRAALDDFGVQLSAQYAKLASAYDRTVAQRNSLLKEYPVPEGILGVWDEALASAGAALSMHRAALLGRIRSHFTEVYARIAPHERADVAYRPSIGELGSSREETEALMLTALAEARTDELRRGLTLVGPHRDEVSFSIDGRAARDFGSQGQQRSLVLAWKIAEVEVTRDILGTSPILLLDDVMSELDAARREAIMAFIEGGIQTVITTTNLGYFSDAVLDAAKVVRVDDGE